MKHTRLQAKRGRKRRTAHPIPQLPLRHLSDGSAVTREYHTITGAIAAMYPLRGLARGKPCQVRLPGCDGGGATTVLAHFRLLPYCGIGMKPSDLAFGAWCCGPCHAAADFREATAMTTMEIRHAHALGVMRTIAELEKLGVIK